MWVYPLGTRDKVTVLDTSTVQGWMLLAKSNSVSAPTRMSLS